MFNGPILIATAIDWAEAACEVSFFESSFARYLWARAEGNVGLSTAPALYSAVLATTVDGALLAGRMSGATSTPDRVQLPGGNVERAHGSSVSTATARRVAARELAEEVGLEVETDNFRLTHVKFGGDYGDVGLFFTVALPVTLTEVGRCFDRHVASLRARGSFVEFSELVAFSREDPINAAAPPFAVDYMDDAVRVALRLGDGSLRYAAPTNRGRAVSQFGVSSQ